MLIARYLLPGRAGRFVLLIGALGCAGVAIGVASLVLVVSFMNGAEARLGGQIASADGHVFVTRRNALGTWSGMQQRLEHVRGVGRVIPSLDVNGLVSADGRTLGAELQGIQPANMKALPALANESSALMGRAPRESGTVALGSGLAMQLGVGPGGHIAITLPRVAGDDLDVVNFEAVVAGIIDTEVEAFDSRRVVMPVADLQRYTNGSSPISRTSVWLKGQDDQAILDDIRRAAGPHMTVRTWRDMNRSLFAALQQERFAMTAIISMVTLVALSNITSSMVMLVRHKMREIAILRTMGMGRFSIARVFIGVAAVIGVAGECAGLCIGLALKSAKDPAVRAIEAHLRAPSAELDALASIPLAISGAQFGWIMGLVSLGVILSTLYPAVRATTVSPAEALRW